MNPDDFELQVQEEASHFAFIRSVVTLDKTSNTIKLRLYITTECFVQLYANLRKGLLSYTLVLHQIRLYGRDNDGRGWHRHPHLAPNDHDFGAEGARAVSLTDFLNEVQQILAAENVL
jgi:hypothetical protein